MKLHGALTCMIKMTGTLEKAMWALNEDCGKYVWGSWCFCETRLSIIAAVTWSVYRLQPTPVIPHCCMIEETFRLRWAVGFLMHGMCVSLPSLVIHAVTTSSVPVSDFLSVKYCTSRFTGALGAETDCTEIMMTSSLRWNWLPDFSLIFTYYPMMR